MTTTRARIIHKSHAQWVVTNVFELRRLFDERPYLRTGKRVTVGIEHLKTNYAKAEGTKRLGFTVIRPTLVITFNPHSGGSDCEMRVECKEGIISRDEALGVDWIPTPAEVWEQAAEIRRNNDAMGLVRDGDFVGFDLKTVYPSRMPIG